MNLRVVECVAVLGTCAVLLAVNVQRHAPVKPIAAALAAPEPLALKASDQWACRQHADTTVEQLNGKMGFLPHDGFAIHQVKWNGERCLVQVGIRDRDRYGVSVYDVYGERFLVTAHVVGLALPLRAADADNEADVAEIHRLMGD